MIDFSQPFNFAQYLFDLNQGRGDKMAYIDDHGSLSHAQSAQQRSAEQFLVHLQLLDQSRYRVNQRGLEFRRPDARHPVQSMAGPVKAVLSLP